MDIRKAILLLSLLPILAWGGQYQFVLPDTSGKMHSLDDYQGKWVVVNYWATWCPPCLDEIPELIEFHEQHSKKDAVVLGVNYEMVDSDYLKTFIDEFFISYPILKADHTRPPPFGRIFGLPTTYIISPTGELVKTRTGAVNRAYLEAIIQQPTNKGQVSSK